MNKYFTFLALFFFVNVHAQTKTDGVSGKPVVINASDKSRIDYFPSIVQLTQSLVPSSEYFNKKVELEHARNAYEAQHPKSEAKKTRGNAMNPMVVKSYQGNSANNVPNDNDIAVSNGGKVLSVVNSNLQVLDDTGLVLLNKSLTALFYPIDTFSWISDPRVLYDPNADRFILVCFTGALSTSSQILVAFSQTNDPAGDWNCYALNGASFNDSTWSDYPIIAISDKDLFMTFNQVKDNVSWTIGFKQSVIWQISKQEGYSGNPLLYTLWSDIKYNGTNLRNICPAKYQTTSMGNNMYFLTLRNVASTNDSVFVTEITDSKVSGNAQMTQKLLITPTAYGFPPNARQKKFGNNPRQYLMTNDARVLAAVYENDYVHWGSNTITSTMNAVVYLGTIKNISSASPVIKGDIITASNMEFGYPSMAYLGNDHKLMYTFSHCYTDSFPGTSVLYRNGNEEYSDIVAVVNGVSNINRLSDSVERWGDYTNIQKMYTMPNRCYLCGSWGQSNYMRTQVGIIDNLDFPTAVENLTPKFESVLFPNPVTNQRFGIRFTLEKTQQIDFVLYDIQGRKLNHLLRNYTKQGEHEFSFEVSSLSKGNYLLQLETKEGVLSTHKIIIAE